MCVDVCIDMCVDMCVGPVGGFYRLWVCRWRGKYVRGPIGSSRVLHLRHDGERCRPADDLLERSEVDFG